MLTWHAGQFAVLILQAKDMRTHSIHCQAWEPGRWKQQGRVSIADLYADAVLHQMVEQVRVEGQAHLAHATSHATSAAAFTRRNLYDNLPPHAEL